MARELDIEFIETIATCGCTHSLEQHDAKGCTVPDCNCELEREAVVVGEIEAIDEL